MSVYRDEEILALRETETRRIICRQCSTQQQWNDMTEEDIITQEDVDKKEFVYFCDECRKKLKVGVPKDTAPRPSIIS